MSTTYTLFDPERKSFNQTFCDFTSENGFVWTLLESFTLANRKYFKSRSFLQDYPINENSFKWNKFRLSLPIMNSTLSHSTHFRATCNFNTDGLVTRDCLRNKTTDFNILLLKKDSCEKMEFINIRGYDCYDCTAKMTQKSVGTFTTIHTTSIIVSSQVVVMALLNTLVEKTTLDFTTQSTFCTDARPMIMLQRSGGLENSKFFHQTKQTPFTHQKDRTRYLDTKDFNLCTFRKHKDICSSLFGLKKAASLLRNIAQGEGIAIASKQFFCNSLETPSA